MWRGIARDMGIVPEMGDYVVFSPVVYAALKLPEERPEWVRVWDLQDVNTVLIVKDGAQIAPPTP